MVPLMSVDSPCPRTSKTTGPRLLRRHRQANRELASVVQASAGSGDAATMAFDQTAHQGKPDTEARVRAPRRRIRLDKEIKHVRQDVRGNADARIANANDGLARFPFHG